MGTSTNIVVHGMLLDYGLRRVFVIYIISCSRFNLRWLGYFIYSQLGKRNSALIIKGFSQQVKEDAKEYIAEMHVEASFQHVNQSVTKAGLQIWMVYI